MLKSRQPARSVAHLPELLSLASLILQPEIVTCFRGTDDVGAGCCLMMTVGDDT